MSADRHRVEVILAQALAITDAFGRRQYLDGACVGDADLRGEVDSLLAAHEQAGNFLEVPPTVVKEAEWGGAPSDSSGAGPAPGWTTNGGAEAEGDCLGRYKLIERLGEGGMGVVWIAAQEEPMRRRVALKIIKVGMDTREVIARFEAERQALALMDHPNIAKVHDGGATDNGRPYFVMELVRGVCITAYCDQHHLAVPERLALFIQVCQAVQHAHQKGIIHRDLKPSNMLVTVLDGVPVPKVIDFGIAKATGQKLTDKTLLTGLHAWMGTPAYMSPEQTAMSGLDIDTRCDIYSLGVVLYELLTGQTPFDAKALLAAGLDGLRRVIREREPAWPSTRLRALSETERTTIARRRRTEAPKLIHVLRGDLDWIVMKCLEKDPARRYETANGLAADLRRHLNSEPVVARPPSAAYRWRKFAWKHRGAMAVVAAFVVVLIGATVASSALALWAHRERGRAVAAQAEAGGNAREARSAEADARAVLEFFQDNVLAAARPEGQDGGLGRETTIRAAVDAAEADIPRGFTNRPLVEAAIRQTLGVTYHYLGEEARALRQLERAVSLREAHLGRNHDDTLVSLHSLAVAYRGAGRLTNALSLFEETRRLSTVHRGADHRKTLVTANNLATTYWRLSRLDDALALFEHTLSVQQARFGPDDTDTVLTRASLAQAYHEAGRPEKALALFQETLQRLRSKFGPTHPDTLTAMHNLANAYRQAGRRAEALDWLKETLELRKAKLGPDHSHTLVSMHSLAVAYRENGQVTDALALLEETVRRSKASAARGPEHPHTLVSANNLAMTYLQAGRLADALSLFEETLRLQTAKLGLDHLDTMITLANLARAYAAAGRMAEALPHFEKSVELLRRQLGPDHPQTLTAMNNLAEAYLRVDRFDEAIPLLEHTIEGRAAKLGKAHPYTVGSRNNLALAYLGAKRFGQAEQLLRAVLDEARSQEREHLKLADALTQLGHCLLRQGQFAEAELQLREALPLREANQPGRSPVFHAQGLLGWALLGQKNHAQAEPQLLQAWAGLAQREADRPSSARQRLLKETAARIAQLYQEWDRPDAAAAWQERSR